MFVLCSAPHTYERSFHRFLDYADILSLLEVHIYRFDFGGLMHEMFLQIYSLILIRSFIAI